MDATQIVGQITGLAFVLAACAVWMFAPHSRRNTNIGLALAGAGVVAAALLGGF